MLDKNFNPKSFEKNFSFDIEASRRKADGDPFMVLLPPPNVTGSLHVGHALCFTLQDILARYKRLKGYDVLFQPGLDHAGIVTQLLVEKQLYDRGAEKGSVSREALLKEIWFWKESSACAVIEQLKTLGISCDFSRLRFTLDEGSKRAVAKLFVKLYNDNLIYRGERMVNWDPQIRSAISDLEVVEKEVDAQQWYIKYRLEDSNDAIVVATTRPETIFGDVAIAVNPRDRRHKKFIGKNAYVPLIDRLIPIVADEYADSKKGSGAVKITPAHDFNDFEVGKRHRLPIINIMNDRGELNGAVPEIFQYMDRFEARRVVVDFIEKKGQLVKVENIKHMAPFGDRSGAMLEPLITNQWFLDAARLAIPALEVVRNGQVVFSPKHWENIYFEWLNDIKPWCISRQIWWGHQIPAWYGPDGQLFVAETAEEATQKAVNFYGKNSVELVQDNDVLDTWFSSGMWPFIVLGWPQNSEEFERLYSNMMVVTGFDIIFFWVARMIMMGIYATGKVPFKNVYIHALVRDEKGRKMSKSKGNVIDPLVLCEAYGADAVRYTLASMSSPGRDIKMNQKSIEIGRNFLTKLWNAVRFAQINSCLYCSEFDVNSVKHPLGQWIVQKIKTMILDVEVAVENYRFDEAIRLIQQCVWNSFCDWYMELIKPILQSDSLVVAKNCSTNSSVQNTLLKKDIRDVTGWAILQLVRVLYPFTPFIAKKLSGELEVTDMSWPDAAAIDIDGSDSLRCIGRLQEAITSIRSMRQCLGVSPSEKLEISVESASQELIDVVAEYGDAFSRMAGVSVVRDIAGQSIPLVVDSGIIHVGFGDRIDVVEEKKRLNEIKKKFVQIKAESQKKLRNKNFLSKASADVVQEHNDRVKTLNERITQLDHAIKSLELI
ncbi:MAG: valine--tRNA ligase [Holosporaceae bacterium]|jgi:valyl-tRNA synthetase|nr:valine--tRNA ligase [Holosporaceae bacterium]